jgi:alkylhydroperoxidase family enzyme
MTLVPLLDPAADPVAAEAMAVGLDRYGRPLATWQAMAHHPDLLRAYFPFMFTHLGPGPLSQDVKLLVALRVVVLARCPYTTAHRWTAAMGAGIDVTRAHDAAAGRARDEVELAQALVLARDTHLGQTPSGDRSALSDAQVVDVVFTASWWGAIARLNAALQLPLDMDPAPFHVDEVV